MHFDATTISPINRRRNFPLISTKCCVAAYTALLLLLQAPMANADNADYFGFLKPYQAVFDVSTKGKSRGNANRKLSVNGDQWQLDLNSKIKFLGLSGKTNEKVTFATRGEWLQTLSQQSSTKITAKKARKLEQNFDWDNKLETGSRKGKTWSLPLDQPYLNQVSHLTQIRADLSAGKTTDFEYLLSYKGKRKTYQYEYSRGGKIKVPLGEFDTVKLTRTAGDGSEFSVWLTPSLDYFPVKIRQIEADEPERLMQLKKLAFEE